MNRAGAALTAMLLLLTACTHRQAPKPSPSSALAPTQQDFMDVQPGWTMKVVVPMLRSGGYILPSLKAEMNGNTGTIQTGDDFLGYETAYYKTTARSGGGVRIRFTHADVWEKGKTHRKNTPLLPLFQDALEARYIRLVYLVRIAKTEHDMAIIAGNDSSQVEEITSAVEQHADCSNRGNATCIWVPNGVAVTRDLR